MEETMVYIWKASWVLALFFVAYRVLLKNETFFIYNRLFLILGLLGSFLVPLLYVKKYIQLLPTTFTRVIPAGNGMAQASYDIQAGIGIDTLIISVYGIGVLFFSIKFAVQLCSLKNFIQQGIHEKKGAYVFVATSRNVTPFSFFKYIVFNPDCYQKSELSSIISHEKVHCSQWHSVDIILAHLTQIIFWFHPISWLYKKDVQQNLEFLADAGASKNIPSLKAYEYALLKVSGSQYCTPITNNFYNSLIKKRIVMLHRSKSSNRNLWKYFTVLPLLLTFVLLFNTKVVAQNAKSTELAISKIEIVIDKNSDDGHMDQDIAFLKERGVTLKVKKLKRNKDGEITAIQIAVHADQSNGQFETNAVTPIQPIKISIDGDGRNISFNSAVNKTDTGLYDDDYTLPSASSHGKTIILKKKVDDENSDEKNEKTTGIHSDNDAFWMSDSEEGQKEIKIKNRNGKETITVNGKEISREEFDKMQDEGGEDTRRITVQRNTNGGNNQVMIMKDSDDADDIEIIDTDQSGFFFLDTEDGENPVFFIDGKEATQEAVKKLNLKEIESIDIINGEPAIKEYGTKAKDGVFKITTKKN